MLPQEIFNLREGHQLLVMPSWPHRGKLIRRERQCCLHDESLTMLLCKHKFVLSTQSPKTLMTNCFWQWRHLNLRQESVKYAPRNRAP